MSKKYPYIIAFLVFILGIVIYYFIYPLPLWKKELVSNLITKADFWSNQIGFLQAVGTLSAVVVALFLEELRSLFKKVIFTIDYEKAVLQEETESKEGRVIAKCYYSILKFTNSGNLNAENCELYLDNVEFQLPKSDAVENVPVPNIPIEWTKDYISTYISANGTRQLKLFKMTPPQKQYTPNNEEETQAAKFIFLGCEETDAIEGEWTLYYSLNCRNTKPYRFKVLVSLKGEWQERLAEMHKYLTINIKEL